METISETISNSTLQWTLVIVLLTTLHRLYLTLWCPSFLRNAPRVVTKGLPIVGALRFWTARCGFFKEWRTKQQHFSFRVGAKQVLSITGLAARKIFSIVVIWISVLGKSDDPHLFTKLALALFYSYEIWNGEKVSTDTDTSRNSMAHFNGTVIRMLRGEELVRSRLMTPTTHMETAQIPSRRSAQACSRSQETPRSTR
jgi:hypothetical protein